CRRQSAFRVPPGRRDLLGVLDAELTCRDFFQSINNSASRRPSSSMCGGADSLAALGVAAIGSSVAVGSELRGEALKGSALLVVFKAVPDCSGWARRRLGCPRLTSRLSGCSRLTSRR